MNKVSLKQLANSHRSMICFLIIIILLLLLSPGVRAQIAKLDAKKLSLTFSVFRNDYNGNGQTTAALELLNRNKTALPSRGWKIYFTMKSMVRLAEGEKNFILQKKNGNLFEFSPTPAFTGLAKNEIVKVMIHIGEPVYNKNDQPEGFYIVWDNALSKGYDISFSVKNNIIHATQTSDFAATIYHRNAAIDTKAASVPAVFPTPLSIKNNNHFFELSANTRVIADEIFQREALTLSNEIKDLFGNPDINAANVPQVKIIFKEGLGAEGYSLDVQDSTIIYASTNAGAFYGIQTFKILWPSDVWKKSAKRVKIAGTMVTDAPLFPYRGLMIDVARDFQTKEEILHILDLMAIYKLNKFHFHLTDDEGWRLEIRGIPELTSFGATRGHTLDEKQHLPSAYGSGADTGKLYGSGFYTRKDFIEILKYARDRHITVIPEIESPGHARAAIKAMDHRYEKYLRAGDREEALRYFLRDSLDQSEYSTPQWFHDNVMNAAVPSVYTFINKVTTEIHNLYVEAGVPLTTIHFGGDEVPAGTWEKSPACNALLAKDSALDNTDDLWYYYVGKVNNILKQWSLPMSGWEEIGLRKTILDGNKVMIPNPDFTGAGMRLYVWNNIGGNEDLAYRLANSGYKVVLTPVTHFYLDMTQYKTYDEPGYYWGSVTDIEKTYGFIPFDFLKNIKEDDQGRPVSPLSFANRQRLTDYGKQNILGLQGALWAETLKGPQQLEYMLLPRLAALAERAWASVPSWAEATDTAVINSRQNHAWSAFAKQVSLYQLPLLDHYKGGYNYRIPPAGAIIKDGAVVANTQFSGLSIRYTTDGTEPAATSRLYDGPVKAKGVITFKVFNATGRSSYVTVVDNR